MSGKYQYLVAFKWIFYLLNAFRTDMNENFYGLDTLELERTRLASKRIKLKLKN